MGLITEASEDYYGGVNLGGYQFVTLETMVNQFMVAYVGNDKTITTIRKADVAFHAQRAIQELSFDTLVSSISLEIVVPPSLTMILPQDYINYSQLSWSDSSGIEHMIYPTHITSNPASISQNAAGDYNFVSKALIFNATSTTSDNFQASTPSENQDNYQDNTYWPAGGERYGLDPQHAQTNGSFFIDQATGKIHFSSNISGKTVILKYISDGVGGSADGIVVHKFAEEAVYKWIAHAILSTRANTPEYLVSRYKKERFAATRQAKLRLSNINIGELTQIMRGKSKQIKH